MIFKIVIHPDRSSTVDQNDSGQRNHLQTQWTIGTRKFLQLRWICMDRKARTIVLTAPIQPSSSFSNAEHARLPAILMLNNVLIGFQNHGYALLLIVPAAEQWDFWTIELLSDFAILSKGIYFDCNKKR